MARNVLRLPGVLRKTGYGKSTWYDGIAKGRFPKGTKIDPEGRVVIWFEDEIEAIQTRAIEAAKVETAA